MPTNSRDGTADRPVIFSPVSVDRVSQVIVDQIRVLIHDGRLKPGDRLPSERELCERFNVSRVTVREALRILEANGLVTIRVGARGGAFITSPTAERLGEGLTDLLSLSPMTAADITETRLVLELGILPMVVERATEEDIEALFEMVEEGQKAVEGDVYTADMSAAFHARVAACTHNPAVEMLVQSFRAPLLMSLEESHIETPMGRRGTDEHRELARAIQRRDLDAAREVVSRHLRRTANRVGIHIPESNSSDTVTPQGDTSAEPDE